MTFFSVDEASTLENITASSLRTSGAVQTLHSQLLDLHRILQSRLQTQHIDLYIATIRDIITTDSVVHRESGGVLVIPYGRHSGTAITVERLMGREHVVTKRDLETHRHPIIELRLAPGGITLELVLSPDAWWDQENLAGKLTLTRYQQEFHKLLQDFPTGYSTGFWQGIHLSDMHLITKQFQHRGIMDEWMRTFEPGKDWFRMGIWYEWDADELNADTIEDTLTSQFKVLYPLYQFINWTSENNYRDFYEGAV
jgi:hypothetical protein